MPYLKIIKPSSDDDILKELIFTLSVLNWKIITSIKVLLFQIKGRFFAPDCTNLEVKKLSSFVLLAK